MKCDSTYHEIHIMKSSDIVVNNLPVLRWLRPVEDCITWQLQTSRGQKNSHLATLHLIMETSCLCASTHTVPKLFLQLLTKAFDFVVVKPRVSQAVI